MSDQKAPRIIVKKKIVHRGGHHGGAWKVAYADFVTAMMSLFIVLWLMNTNAKVKQAVAGYFRDPAGVGKLSGSDREGHDKSLADPVIPPPEAAKQDMEKLKTDLDKALRNLPNFETMKGHIAVTVTDEGIRMDLMETAKGLFFANGSPVPTKEGEAVLRAVSGLVSKLPNRLMIEGHTDSVPFASGAGYSNWELSSARANSARILMEGDGVRGGQILQIRGFADQQLRLPAKPEDPSNRRITIIVLNVPKKADLSPAGATKKADTPEPKSTSQ
jgi:chemotaxis protein MotB